MLKNPLLTVLPKPQVLYKSNSAISGDIEVIKFGKETKLLVGGYVQSVNADLSGIENRVWGKLVTWALEKNKQPKNILILGLGGGTEVALLKNKVPQAEIVVVEIDEEIVKIARDYFGIKSSDNVTIIQKDGIDVIKKPASYGLNYLFDVVIIDVYCGGSFPAKFHDPAFFADISKNLNETGIALFNRIMDISSEDEINIFKNTLAKYFTNVEARKVTSTGNSANVIFICMK